MTTNKRVLDTLVKINMIFNDKSIAYEDQLHRALLEIVSCLRTKSGSIMLKKGGKKLAVVSSTDRALLDVHQPLDEESPSTWVVKNKVPLYIESVLESNSFLSRFDHYMGQAFLLAPIIWKDKTIGIICLTDRIGGDAFTNEEQKTLLDITGLFISAHENQHLIDSLRKRQKTLRKKNQQLRKLEDLKTDLFNMLIHDLKGPISELIANLDILSYTASDENQEYVEAARFGCDTLYSMVSNLLDIARLEEGKLKLVLERIEPQDLIQESLARLFGLIKIKELTFSETYPENEDREDLWADRGILLRILQNLLTNAIGFTPPGSTIEVGFEDLTHSKIKLFVKDRGPGIPAQHREAIFDKHYQLEKKGDGRIYTTGLGLTFCRMAVRAHHGEIGVESRKTEGSSFYFILPVGDRNR